MPFKRIGLSLLISFAVIFVLCDGFYVLPDPTPVPVGNPSIAPKSIGIYIINMDASKERYRRVKNFADKLPYPITRISAIDGNTITTEQLKQYVDLDSYVAFMSGYPKSGTIGCFLSHAKAWREFLSSNYETALILEDDVEFTLDDVTKAISMLQANESLWDIASLEINHKGSPLSVYQNKDYDQKIVSYLTKVSHTGAYLINRSAAVKLLAKSSPIKMPVDHYFTRSWELGTKFVGVEPRPVYQPKLTSDIATSKNFDDLPKKIWIINNTKHAVYAVKTHMADFVYNFRMAMKALSRRVQDEVNQSE